MEEIGWTQCLPGEQEGREEDAESVCEKEREREREGR